MGHAWHAAGREKRKLAREQGVGDTSGRSERDPVMRSPVIAFR